MDPFAPLSPAERALSRNALSLDGRLADAPRLRDATRVEPRPVAQIGFAEWARDGRLRRPRFLGLRDDRAPEEVVRE